MFANLLIMPRLLAGLLVMANTLNCSARGLIIMNASGREIFHIKWSDLFFFRKLILFVQLLINYIYISGLGENLFFITDFSRYSVTRMFAKDRIEDKDPMASTIWNSDALFYTLTSAALSLRDPLRILSLTLSLSFLEHTERKLNWFSFKHVRTPLIAYR